MAVPIRSLKDRLSELHAERVRSWPPEQLQSNIRQRLSLVESAKDRRFVTVGDLASDFRLPEVDGGEVSLFEILKTGPAVLLFFRFAGCQACNIALPYYEEALLPGLKSVGASLIALSPQIPERLVEIKRRHRLGFLVANDTDNALARGFGITFEPSTEVKAQILAEGRAAVTETTGASTWELPMPAIMVIGQDRRIAFVEVSPDWLVRTEASEVLAAVANQVRTPVPA